MGKVTELPIKQDLTLEEAYELAKRRGATKGVITFFTEDDWEVTYNFGTPSRRDTLWLAKHLELLSLELLDVE